MKRRQVIARIGMFSAAAVAGWGGYKGYHLFKTPQLDDSTLDKPLIDALAETIIPRTDTPGAIDAGVGAFIILMLKDCTQKKSLNRFIDGIADLKSYTLDVYDKSFVDCTQAEKNEIVEHFRKKGKPRSGIVGKVERKLIGDSFFQTLKNYTVLGYCTSRLGATQGLAFEYVPGKFENTMLQPRQRAWATQ
ncbi:MAG: gluconate 2-dehydrogenase subunit 3 family protein [Chitinophagaceae bacterium]|nr:MAG: gluconate 2-dehydrogenase subunit 3 family protein [Chitinophagaceae bacterium]